MTDPVEPAIPEETPTPDIETLSWWWTTVDSPKRPKKMIRPLEHKGFIKRPRETEAETEHEADAPAPKPKPLNVANVPLPPIPKAADLERLPPQLRAAVRQMPLHRSSYREEKFKLLVLREAWNVELHGLVMLYHAVRHRDVAAVGILTRAGAKETVSLVEERGVSAITLAMDIGESGLVKTLYANGLGGRDFARRRGADLYRSDSPERLPELGGFVGAPARAARALGRALRRRRTPAQAGGDVAALWAQLERDLPVINTKAHVDLFRVRLREFALAFGPPGKVAADAPGFALRGPRGRCLLYLAVARDDVLGASLILQTARIFRLDDGREAPLRDARHPDDAMTAAGLARRRGHEELVKLLAVQKHADLVPSRRTKAYRVRAYDYATCADHEVLAPETVRWLNADLKADFLEKPPALVKKRTSGVSSKLLKSMTTFQTSPKPAPRKLSDILAPAPDVWTRPVAAMPAPPTAASSRDSTPAASPAASPAIMARELPSYGAARRAPLSAY